MARPHFLLSASIITFAASAARDSSAAGACAPGGILVQFLERVPYNTSQAWINAYPQLPSIMSDAPCVPKYNVIADNVICGDAGSLPWIDVNVTVIEGWGSTVSNNTVNTNC